MVTPSLSDLIQDWLDGDGKCHSRNWEIVGDLLAAKFPGGPMNNYLLIGDDFIQYTRMISIRNGKTSYYNKVKLYAASPDFFDELEGILNNV